MALGSTVPPTFYAFACSLNVRIRCWTLTSLAELCFPCFDMKQGFGKPHLRPFKALIFGFVALSFFIRPSTAS